MTPDQELLVTEQAKRLKLLLEARIIGQQKAAGAWTITGNPSPAMIAVAINIPTCTEGIHELALDFLWNVQVQEIADHNNTYRIDLRYFLSQAHIDQLFVQYFGRAVIEQAQMEWESET